MNLVLCLIKPPSIAPCTVSPNCSGCAAGLHTHAMFFLHLKQLEILSSFLILSTEQFQAAVLYLLQFLQE
jgi:hypothetical protein